MAQPTPSSRLSVLLVTDIVGSTDLKRRLGLEAYARLLAEHDALFKRLIADYPSAEILKDTGDGYFASFATTSDAVRFALRFQHELPQPAPEGQPLPVLPVLRVRVGVHVGEVAQMDPEATGKPKIVGLAADVVARVAHLALGGQILLTKFAFNEARQFISSMPVENGAPTSGLALRWVAHGPYRLRGADEPIDAFEVGVDGRSPLVPPPGNEDARRAVGSLEEETLGWRPAIGLEIPERQHWLLERRLGEGGFGEVWLGHHAKLGVRHVFKFCFDADRLRSFKREIALFRLLREALGERRDIARLYGVKLDAAPYFIESEYTEGGDLAEWAESRGGIGRVPIGVRLDLVARIADAVAAAHSVGILHKDLKPSNILIAADEQDPAQPRPRLADFGIGVILDPAALRDRAITEAGFTLATADQMSRTGTRLYAPPEALVGRPFTVQGDVYALGVILYQMAVADLHRPLAEGWEREVDDPLVRADIAACVDGDPQRRLSSASELAKRLRSLPERRAARAAEESAARVAARRRRVLRLTSLTAAALVLLTGLAVASALHDRRLWREAETARAAEARLRQEAEAARAAEARQRQIAGAVNHFLDRTLTSIDPDELGKDVTVVRAVDAAYDQLKRSPNEDPEVRAAILGTLGRSYRSLGKLDRSVELLRESHDLLSSLKGDADAETAIANAELAISIHESGKAADAELMLRGAVDTLRAARGPDDPAVLTFQNNYAQVLLQLNRIDEAERIIQDVYDVRLKRNGPDDDYTLSALETLSGVVYTRGDIPRAAEMFKQVYEGRQRSRGPDAPLTLMAGSNAAVLIHRLGRHAEADVMLAPLIERQRKVLGDTHPRTMQAIQNEAAILAALDRYDECIAREREVVALRTRAQGPEHRDTLAAKRYLGSYLGDANRADEGVQVLREVLDVQRRTLGDDHTETIDTKRYLSASLSARNQGADREDGFVIMREVVDTAAKKFGSSHPTTLLYRLELASGLSKFKHYEESEQQFQTVWQDAQSPKIPGATRTGIATRFARLYELWGKPEQAEHYKQLAIAATQPTTAPTTGPAAD